MANRPVQRTCVGRFVIDWPVKARVQYGGEFKHTELLHTKRVDGFSSVQKKLKEKAERLKTVKMQRSESDDAIFKGSGVDPDTIYAKTRLINFAEKPGEVVIGYHDSDDTAHFTAQVHRVIDTQDYVFQATGAGANHYHHINPDVVEAANAFQPRKSGVIPRKPGFCVEHGIYVSSELDNQHNETFDLVAHFPDHPNAKLDILSSTGSSGHENYEPLEERARHGVKMMNNAGGDARLIREGDKKALSQDGKEAIIKMPHHSFYKLIWNAIGVADDNAKPSLEITLMVDPKNDSEPSFQTDEEVETFWNEILNSIKIRDSMK